MFLGTDPREGSDMVGLRGMPQRRGGEGAYSDQATLQDPCYLTGGQPGGAHRFWG